MSTVTIQKVITPQNLEDWLSALPSVIGLFSLAPGVSFVLLLAVGSLAKAVAGMTQWPSAKRWQDWALFAAAIFAAASTFTPAPAYFAVYALALGFIAKGIADAVQKQFEDLALVIFGFIALVLQIAGLGMYATDMLALAQILKALPGIFGYNPGVTAALPATSPKPA